jgi:Fe-S-cluster containining protein
LWVQFPPPARKEKMDELLKFYADQEPYIADLRSRSSCSPACNHCCYPLLRYSVAEAILLLREYPLEPGVIDEARENLRVTANDPEDWLRRKYPCPFLRDDTCQVYAVRPWICRSHFIVGNPEGCSGGTVHVLDITSSNPAYFKVMNELRLPWGPIPYPLALSWAQTYLAEGSASMFACLKKDTERR